MHYEHGTHEALVDFGLTPPKHLKTASAGAALGALAGAGLGYAADPEHSPQAAIMGGLAGGSIGHGISRMGAGAAHMMPPPAAHPAAPPVHTPPAAPPPAPAPTGAGPRDTRTFQHAHEMGKMQHQEGMFANAKDLIRKETNSADEELARLHGHKLSVDFGASVGASGPSFSMFGSNQERLPGMHRWVPRETVEDVYRQLDMGTDPADVTPTSSPLKSALGGAGVGGIAGLTMGKSLKGGLLGAGIGAGVGLAGHLMGGKDREADTQEALYGVMNERAQEQAGTRTQNAPKQHDSAREAMPLTVSTNVGM